jgi:hypothetical protein
MQFTSSRRILALLLVVFMPLLAEASWITVNPGISEHGQASVLSDTGESIRLAFELGGYRTEELTLEDGTYVQLSVPGMAPTLEKSEPELPMWTGSVIIPDQGTASIRIVREVWEEAPTLPVVPSKGNLYRTVDPETIPYVFSSSYSEDAWFPATKAGISDPFILRDFRGVTITLYPLRYNGAKQKLSVLREIELEVTVSGSGGVNEKVSRAEEICREFLPIYEGRFLNFDSRENEISEQAGKMLVIAADQFFHDMDDLVTWKIEKGIDTRIVRYPDDIGGTGSTAIKNYIQSEYGTERITFVLLVGDKEHVPTLTFAGGEADPMYTLLEGSDVYPDAYISRFSVQGPSDVATMVERSIAYELEPTPETAWYHKATGIASNEGSPPDYQWMNGFRTKLLDYNYTEMDQFYGYGASASQVTNALNEGRGLVLYMGHGYTTGWSTTGFNNSHVNALTNDNMLPLISSVACVNGDFSSTTCFGEAWLRATHNGNPTGAIACYASSINQSWVPPQYGQQGLVDSLVNDRYNTVGGVLFMGSVAMLEHYSGGYAAQEIFNTWIIFGDCSVQFRSDVPSGMTVDHPSSVPEGAQELVVTVPGVADALVGVSKGGIFYGSAYTDETGTASVQLEPALPPGGTVTLVVTGYNRTPYMTELPVGGGDTEPPTAPSNVQFTADGTLSWSPSTDNIGVQHYLVYRATQPHFNVSGLRPIRVTTDTSAAFPGSIGDVEINYFFRIVAVDLVGNESEASSIAGEFDFQLMD